MADHPDPYVNSGVALSQATAAAATAIVPGAPITTNTFLAMLQAFETALVGAAVTDIGVSAGPAAGVIASAVAPTVQAAANQAIGNVLGPILADLGAFFAKIKL